MLLSLLPLAGSLQKVTHMIIWPYHSYTHTNTMAVLHDRAQGCGGEVGWFSNDKSFAGFSAFPAKATEQMLLQSIQGRGKKMENTAAWYFVANRGAHSITLFPRGISLVPHNKQKECSSKRVMLPYISRLQGKRQGELEE